VGYRVAQQVTGRGAATSAVRELSVLASWRHGLRALRAATSHANVASRRVLLNADFVQVGPADPSDIGGKQGDWFQLDCRPGV
jgi:ribosomal-protein-alanine N-acetyltransferase